MLWVHVYRSYIFCNSCYEKDFVGTATLFRDIDYSLPGARDQRFCRIVFKVIARFLETVQIVKLKISQFEI